MPPIQRSIILASYVVTATRRRRRSRPHPRVGLPEDNDFEIIIIGTWHLVRAAALDADGKALVVADGTGRR
jgi:hypothetical protein